MNEYSELQRVVSDFHPLIVVGDLPRIGTAASNWDASGLTVRTVRGRKMRSVLELFDEVAAALQFPLYFGENKDAFDECIAELDGLQPGAGYVVLVTEPDEVLADAGVDDLEWLVTSLASATRAWAQPIEQGEWWDRPAVPFHVVLAGEPDVAERAARAWARVGSEPVSLGGGTGSGKSG